MRQIFAMLVVFILLFAMLGCTAAAASLTIFLISPMKSRLFMPRFRGHINPLLTRIIAADLNTDGFVYMVYC